MTDEQQQKASDDNDVSSECPFSGMSDDQVEDACRTAEARLEALESEASALERAAADAQQVFKDSPNKNTLADKDIKLQLAENAKERAVDFAGKIDPLLQGRTLRRVKARFLEVGASRDAERQKLHLAHERFAKLFFEFEDRFRAEANAFFDSFEAYNRDTAEHNELVDAHFPHEQKLAGTNLSREVTLLNESLSQRFVSGRAGSAGASLSLHDNGDMMHVRLGFRRLG